ncbi:MAG TPA: pitrilysin family protein [Pyrinomonadaceae bacterium]|nr:pitrilysin family protein [Pyrinomonadaceae bacterium]
MTPELRKLPPQALDPVSFDIAKPTETTLENGLRVIVFENERIPLVSFRLAFLSGDIHDPAGARGLTSAVAAMISEGTEDYTSRQLAEKIERLGASISSSASDDFTIVAASSLSLYSSEILDLLAEVVLGPTFPENELDLYRRNTVEHLKFQRSQPGFLAAEQAARLVYGHHAYSTVAPKAADIEKLDRETLRNLHRERFIPNNAILIVVGDVRSDDLIAEVREHFSDWQPGDPAAGEFTAPPKRDARSVTIVDRPGSAQANIVLTNLAVKRTDPDYFSLLVMNQVLGAGASSRVFMNLREEKGYTYGAYTRLGTKRLAGDFEATAEVRTAVTGDSLREFFYELARIRDENVGDEELRDAKNFLTGVFPLRAETQEGLTNLIVNQYLYGLPDDYLQTYRNQVNAVGAEDVQRVALKHVRPDEMALVIVGDAEEVMPQVHEYADSVEVYNTDGVRQDEAKYTVAATAETAEVAGKWSLVIDFQGQQLPVSLNLEQSADTVTGVLETMLGNGEIADGKVSGNRLSANAKAEMQGQGIEFAIAGKIDGNAMSGTITAPIVPEPLPFTGSRS